MKKILSFIRWKFVIPVSIFLGIVILFFVVFFDPLLARAIEKIGAKLNGAKVDVSDLETKIFKGRLDIVRVQVADKDAPMTNKVDLGPLAFQLDFGQLLKKRVIIPESSAKNLKFGTKRKTSGALPVLLKPKEEKDGEPSAARKLMEKYGDRFEISFKDMKADVKKKIEFDEDDLAIKKQAKGIEAKAESLPARTEEKVKKADFENRLRKVESDLESLKNTPTKGIEAVAAIPKAIEKLNQAKKDLNQIKADAVNLKNEAVGEIKSVRTDINGLKDAKNKDLDDLQSRFNLDFADPEKLTRGIVGPVVLDRLRTALRLIETARRHMPSKKEKETLPAKPRATGMDITFPRPADPPRFWLKLAEISGELKGINVSGGLHHLNTDPPRVGKPTTINLSGKQGRQSYNGEIVFDHTGDVKKDSLQASATGLEITSMAGAGLFAKALQTGTGRGEFKVRAVGENQIGGSLVLGLTGLQFDHSSLLKEAGLEGESSKLEDQLKANLVTGLANGIESMPELQIQATLGGTWADPEMSLSTNLGTQVASVVKTVVGDAVKNQRAELEKRLDAVLKKEQAKLTDKLNQSEGKINGEIAKVQEKIDQEIQKATGMSFEKSPVKVPDLKDLFK